MLLLSLLTTFWRHNKQTNKQQQISNCYCAILCWWHTTHTHTHTHTHKTVTKTQNQWWSMIINVATFQVVARCTLIFFYGIVLYSWQWDMTLVICRVVFTQEKLIESCFSTTNLYQSVWKWKKERLVLTLHWLGNRHYWSSLSFLWGYITFVFVVFFHFFSSYLLFMDFLMFSQLLLLFVFFCIF